jgi:hypothetical protein
MQVHEMAFASEFCERIKKDLLGGTLRGVGEQATLSGTALWVSHSAW